MDADLRLVGRWARESEEESALKKDGGLAFWCQEMGSFHCRNSDLCVATIISVVAEIATDLSSKYPIRPARVHENDRQHEERPDQQEGLRARWGRRLPQRKPVRDDHRPETDCQTE